MHKMQLYMTNIEVQLNPRKVELEVMESIGIIKEEKFYMKSRKGDLGWSP